MNPSTPVRIVTLAADIRAAWSDRSHGDLRPAPGAELPGGRLDRFAAGVIGDAAVGSRLIWLRQVHGATVGVVGATDGTRASARRVARTGADGDGLVSVSPTASLVMVSADCATVALGSAEGVFGAVHAGWRGLLAGVIEAVADAMRELGATTVWGALGPTIHPECYPFSEADLSRVATRYGDSIRSTSSDGRPALDLPGAVGVALGQAGITPVTGIDACTSCGGEYFSHRRSGDRGRQALVVWSVAPLHRGDAPR